MIKKFTDEQLKRLPTKFREYIAELENENTKVMEILSAFNNKSQKEGSGVRVVLGYGGNEVTLPRHLYVRFDMDNGRRAKNEKVDWRIDVRKEDNALYIMSTDILAIQPCASNSIKVMMKDDAKKVMP